MEIIDLLLKSIKGLLPFLNLDSKRNKVSPVLLGLATANNNKSPRTDVIYLRSQPSLQLNRLVHRLESVRAHQRTMNSLVSSSVTGVMVTLVLNLQADRTFLKTVSSELTTIVENSSLVFKRQACQANSLLRKQVLDVASLTAVNLTRKIVIQALRVMVSSIASQSLLLKK